MAHLRDRVRLPADDSIADVQLKRGFLNAEVRGKQGCRRISGTTCVVIAKTVNVLNDAMRHSIEPLFELKNPKNIQQKDHCPLAVCEFLAASYLNRRHGVVSVLTFSKSLVGIFLVRRVQRFFRNGALQAQTR